MGAKLFVFGCLLLVLLGVWFQKSYMASSSADLSFDPMGKEMVQELLSVRPFTSDQYALGKVKSKLKAHEMKYFNNGRMVLTGDIEYTDFDKNGKVSLVINTEKALGEVLSDSQSSNFLHSSKKLKSVKLPEAVKLRLGGQDVILTKNVQIDFVEGLLKTPEDVDLVGPGKKLHGKGFSYLMNSQEYHMGGPIEATLLPSEPTMNLGSKLKQ
jgi:hypothetical protein